MGEAKRRKQKLGSAYGKKQSPLNNPRLQEMHLDKFIEASSQHLSQIIQKNLENTEDLTVKKYFHETQGKLVEKFRVWLDDYLANYEPEDREFLVSSHIMALINLYEDATDSAQVKMLFSLPVICLAYQPYLDEEIDEIVEDFLDYVNELYEMFIEEEKMSDEEE